MNNLTWPTPYAVHYVSWPTLFNVSKNSDPSPIFHSPPPPVLYDRSLTVFFHWMYKMKFSCYQSLLLFMASLFIEFLVERYVACQSRKSDFVFHFAWCVRGLKSLKRFWPYLIVFSASRVVSLSNYFISCLFFISNSMKSSVVYGAI